MLSHFKHTLFASLSLLHISVLCVSTFGASLAHSVNVRDAEPILWQKVKEEDDIIVYGQRNKDASHFKGEGRVKVHDLYSIISMLEDFESMPEWFALLSTITEINRDDYFNRYLHGTISLPIIQERDIVIKISVIPDTKKNSIIVQLKNRHDYIPIEARYIRFPVIEGLLQFDIISETEVNFTYELKSRLGGLIPVGFADYVMVTAPYVTIKDFRTAIMNPKYHNQQTENSTIKFSGAAVLPIANNRP